MIAARWTLLIALQNNVFTATLMAVTIVYIDPVAWNYAWRRAYSFPSEPRPIRGKAHCISFWATSRQPNIYLPYMSWEKLIKCSEAQWSKFSGSQLEKERSSECPVWALWNRWILQRPSQQYTCWLYPLVLYCIECDVCYFWCCTSQMSMGNRSLNTFDMFASVAFPSVLHHVIHALVW